MPSMVFETYVASAPSSPAAEAGAGGTATAHPEPDVFETYVAPALSAAADRGRGRGEPPPDAPSPAGEPAPPARPRRPEYPTRDAARVDHAAISPDAFLPGRSHYRGQPPGTCRRRLPRKPPPPQKRDVTPPTSRVADRDRRHGAGGDRDRGGVGAGRVDGLGVHCSPCVPISPVAPAVSTTPWSPWGCPPTSTGWRTDPDRAGGRRGRRLRGGRDREVARDARRHVRRAHPRARVRSNRADLELVSAAVGEPIERPDAVYVREVTGYSIGGIPPVGHPAPVRPCSTRTCSVSRRSGPPPATRTRSSIAPAALVTAAGATVTRLAE